MEDKDLREILKEIDSQINDKDNLLSGGLAVEYEPYKNVDYPDEEEIKETHQEIEDATQAFLKGGGKIVRVDSG